MEVLDKFAKILITKTGILDEDVRSRLFDDINQSVKGAYDIDDSYGQIANTYKVYGNGGFSRFSSNYLNPRQQEWVKRLAIDNKFEFYYQWSNLQKHIWDFGFNILLSPNANDSERLEFSVKVSISVYGSRDEVLVEAHTFDHITPDKIEAACVMYSLLD